MNDFSEIENELKKLRPARPSPALFERVEEAMANGRAGAPPADGVTRQPTRLPYNWMPLGLGLAAAALLLVFARINLERPQQKEQQIAKISPVPSRETAPAVADKFIPADLTQVIYNRRDEGLQFGYQQPLRRLRYQTRQTVQWRNPATGESLRVSYPSEEIVLIPVSGQ